MTCRALREIWLDSWRATGLTAHADPSEAELREELEQAGWRVRLACSGADVGGFVAFEAGSRQLCQLFVDPPQQRRGVGTMLLDEVKRQMPQGFWLRAAADNICARTFYERRGLRLDGEQPRPDTSSMVAIYVWP
jgi:GNAT superfamily N-acetyltransferase